MSACDYAAGCGLGRLRQLKYLVRADLTRYGEGRSWRAFLSAYLRTPGFRYSVWYRVRALVNEVTWAHWGLRQWLSWRLWRLAIRYGISLPPQVVAGPGLYIGHFGGITVHPEVRFGRDCNLSQSVTIGLSPRGRRPGVPRIGNRVYIGPGAKIFGAITIGDDAAIGANAVVTRDVPAQAVVVGAPARIISLEGSRGYICHTDYAPVPKP